MVEDQGDFVTVKLREAVRGKLDRLIVRLKRDGWTSIGRDREDAPTLSSVVEEATDLLAVQQPRGGRARGGWRR